ncbi:MAG: hypothetical protein IKW83_10810 [Muribaculaceae bacterium]|nr:hypothetical protein [Muribaculaceae bacterium]
MADYRHNPISKPECEGNHENVIFYKSGCDSAMLMQAWRCSHLALIFFSRCKVTGGSAQSFCAVKFYLRKVVIFIDYGNFNKGVSWF